MNDVELATKSVSDLVRDYRTSAVAHAAAIGNGRHRVANREFETLSAVSGELQRRGTEGVNALKALIEDENLSVRVWAATHALRIHTALAEHTLAEAAAGPPSPTRLSAEMTLSEWRAGRL